MLEKLFMWIAQKSSQKEFVCGYFSLRTLRIRRYRIQVDWLGASFYLRLNHMDYSNRRFVKCGFAPWWLLCSLGYFGENNHFVIIQPFQLSVRWAMLWGFKPDLLKEMIAKLLAHECRHVMCGHQRYGFLGFVFLPPLLLVPYILPLAAVAAIFAPAIWKICVLLIAAYFWGMTVYLNHPHEREANLYASDHFEEWVQFVTIEIIG